MLNDIMPPRRPRTSPPSLRTMRSQRLQGYNPAAALSRLKIPASEEIEEIKLDANGEVESPPLRRPHFFWRLSKKARIISVVSTVLIFGLILSVFFVFFPHKEPVKTNAPALQVQAEPPKPTTVASPLSGLQTAPELAKRPVTAIMIENSLDARPQSGLHEAGVVFEAIAEGGITRFMALFQETQPQYIGPVRSLRPYYLDFSTPFQASVAHVGGSPEALAQVRSAGQRDIDQFFNAGAYWRSSARAAPHNMYTSFQRLDQLNSSKGYVSSEFSPWLRKEDSKSATPNVNKIDIRISSTLYNVHYDYDAATNSYLRSEGGRPHLSTASAEDGAGQQLKPKAVVVLVMPYSLNGKYSVYGTAGSGHMFVFQDGVGALGTWHKADRGSQFVFKDSAGSPLALNAGQTWVTLVASADRVTYAP